MLVWTTLIFSQVEWAKGLYREALLDQLSHASSPYSSDNSENVIDFGEHKHNRKMNKTHNFKIFHWQHSDNQLENFSISSITLVIMIFMFQYLSLHTIMRQFVSETSQLLNEVFLTHQTIWSVVYSNEWISAISVCYSHFEISENASRNYSLQDFIRCPTQYFVHLILKTIPPVPYK